MKDHGPWKIKSSEVKYKSPWIQLREDQVVRPDGSDSIFSVVEKLPGVSILPMDDEGNVYLAREFKYTMGAVGIEAASGGKDEGEDFLETAQRELKEEMGITADEWTDLGRVDPFTEGVYSPAQIYLARKLHFADHARESTEILEIEKMPFEEVVRMVMESKITHGPSCVLILKAARFLEGDSV